VQCPPYTTTAAAAATSSATAGEDGGPVRPGFRTGVVIETKPHVLVDPVAPKQPGATLPGGVVLTHDSALLGLVDASLGGRDELVDTSVIHDLLDRAKVNTDLGQVDRDFRAGVDAYYAGRYTESIERFDSVLAIIPSHVQAHKYRDEAQTRRAQQGGGAQALPGVNHFDLFVNAWSGSIVGLGVLVAILFFLLHRRRPPHALPEAPVSPPAVRPPAPEPREPDQTSA
jgi:serine protease Do